MSSWDEFRKLMPKTKSKQAIGAAYCHWKLHSKNLECLGVGEDFASTDKKTEDDAVIKAYDGGKKPLKYKDCSKEDAKYILRCYPIFSGDNLMVILEREGKGAPCSAATVLSLSQVQDDMSVEDEATWAKKVEKLLQGVRSPKATAGVGQKLEVQKDYDHDKDKDKDGKSPGQPDFPKPKPQAPDPEGPPPDKPLPEPMPGWPDPNNDIM